VRASYSRNYTCEQLRYIRIYAYMKADNESHKAGSESRLSSGYALGRVRTISVRQSLF